MHGKKESSTSTLINTNATGNHDIHDGQQTNERDNKNTIHVIGEINGDQYAVVSKRREVVSENNTNKYHLNQDGVVYYSTSVEYDALNHTVQKENLPTQNDYDVALFHKNSEMIYHEAFSERPSSANLEIYDHVGEM